MATAVVAHGGGPTPVLNASLAGIIAECRNHPQITSLLGARFGANGLVSDDFVDLSAADCRTIGALRCTPGSAIGSSRRKIQADGYHRILQVLRGRDIRYLFYTGGNGSMDTAMRIDRNARDAGYELAVIGVPKTIDNDLVETDHTPGYASCGRFFAHAVRDIGADNRALHPPIEILEVLGRNTGWVVAATALARHDEDDPPHLIYFPECGISVDRLCSDIEAVVQRLGWCVVAVCEGQKDDAGGWFGAELISRPGARDPLPANMGQVLAQVVWSRTGLRARSEKPGLLGRSCAAFASEVDREESWRCGVEAVRAAVRGQSAVMAAIRRLPGAEYDSEIVTVPIESVAGHERTFPREWRNAESNNVTRAFVDWARPLIGEVPPHVRIR